MRPPVCIYKFPKVFDDKLINKLCCEEVININDIPLNTLLELLIIIYI
jgi:hypothetical protein